MRRTKRGFLMDTASFFIYCTIATFTPGPTNIVLLSTVHHRGARTAMRYAYGATMGFGVLLGLSALLNAILAAYIPAILTVMRFIGSGYMLYLAYRLCKMSAASSVTRLPLPPPP
ncbi:LysE family translocator, partial [Paenibacillus xanthanilyticus]